METERIVIYGGGGHAKAVIDCLLTEQRNVIGVIDTSNGGALLGVPRFPMYPDHWESDAVGIVAIGDNKARKKISMSIEHKFTNACHPTALVSRHASVGFGNMILHGSIIQAGAALGNHIIVNTGAQIDHDCIVGDYVHIAPGVVLCGSVRIGEGALIGAGCTLIPGVEVGKWAIIGAGSVVINNIPDNATAVGNPARIIKTSL